VPFRTACSDRETESAQEYKHLWGDAVYGAVDDADDGDREATRNIRHRILSFWGAPGEGSWRPFWEQLSSDRETESAEEHAPAGGYADDGADEAADRWEDPWNTSLSLGRWKSLEDSVPTGFGLKSKGKSPLL